MGEEGVEKGEGQVLELLNRMCLSGSAVGA